MILVALDSQVTPGQLLVFTWPCHQLSCQSVFVTEQCPPPPLPPQALFPPFRLNITVPDSSLTHCYSNQRGAGCSVSTDRGEREVAATVKCFVRRCFQSPAASEIWAVMWGTVHTVGCHLSVLIHLRLPPLFLLLLVFRRCWGSCSHLLGSMFDSQGATN